MLKGSYQLPPSVERVLEDVVDVEKLNVGQRILLIKCVLGYTLRIIDCKENTKAEARSRKPDMKKYIGHFLDHNSIIKIGSNIKEDYDLLVKVKNLVYRLLEIQETGRTEVIRRFKSLGLTREDANLYFWLHDLELYEPAIDMMRTACAPFLPPAEMERKCREALATIDKTKYIERHKVVNRNFAYIYRYNPNIDKADVVQQVREKISFAYYLDYPFGKSELHLVNKMKTTVGRTAINLMRRYNREDQKRLVNQKKRPEDPDNYVLLESSIYVQGKNGKEHMIEAGHDLNPHGVENANVLRMTVSLIVKQNKGKRRKVLRLMMQQDSKGFVRFVNETYGHAFETVDQFYKHVNGGEAYNEAIRAYTRMSKKEFREFLKELKHDFAMTD